MRQPSVASRRTHAAARRGISAPVHHGEVHIPRPVADTLFDHVGGLVDGARQHALLNLFDRHIRRRHIMLGHECHGTLHQVAQQFRPLAAGQYLLYGFANMIVGRIGVHIKVQVLAHH